MKIYDISQELLESVVYPGDPTPQRNVVASVSEGSVCNLSTLFLCAHNGTHVDAPYHFVQEGRTIEAIPLEQLVGMAYVAAYSGALSADAAREICEMAKGECEEAAKKILLKGNLTISAEAAETFVAKGVELIGVESQSVGEVKAPMEVHLILLRAGVIPLEGIRLGHVPNGVYLLSAAPLSIKGGDGSPCRAILIDLT